MEVPIIRIEIQGMKESIQQAVAVHSGEFNEMIHHAVEKAFDYDTIQAKIDSEIANSIDDAIGCLSENYLVKAVIQNIVVKSLGDLRDKLEQGE